MDDIEFTKHVASCENALKRFVYYKMPSKADADDILQETLLASYCKRDLLKNSDGFKAWILRIAANKCNDFYRARANHTEFLDDTVLENSLSQSRYGRTVTETVHESLALLDAKDAAILRLVYIERLPQTDIAKMLSIPVGTVKSRLHVAKKRFKAAYPYSPKAKQNLEGASVMQKLPNKVPDYTIVKSEKEPFPVKWEEMMGWFIVPKLGQKLSWAMYDWPEKTRSEVYELEVVGRAVVHGIEGVEITAREHGGGQHEGMPSNRDITRTFVAQLTGTHCRFLSQTHYEGEVKQLFTFLDGDDFLHNWGFGEDNCGNELDLRPKGLIQRNGNIVTTQNAPFLLDVVGRYAVTINGKEHDCLCVIDVETYNSGVLSEQFIDKNGRTVLWRRFNRNDWNLKIYHKPWSEKLPDNQQLIVNGKVYVHWYDCISDYIL